MQSWKTRRATRGGMTMIEFENKLWHRGFVNRTPRVNAIAEYTHPETGLHLYTVSFGQRFSDSLPRILAEFEVAKAGEVHA